MADRNSADIFGRIFRKLASEPNDTVNKRKFALWLWENCSEFDFTPEQLESYDALCSLGLARVGIDLDYPEDGEITLYGPEEGSY